MNKIKPCLCDERKGLKFELEFTKINKIGRGSSPKAHGITIDLLSDTISSNHATIQFKKGKWFFTDESTHGSIINGEKINNTEHFLNHKDQIHIGEYKFVFFDENELGIIGGTQKAPVLDDSFKAKVSQIHAEKYTYEKWKDEKTQELPVVTFVCIILFLLFFVGLFSKFFVDI